MTQVMDQWSTAKPLFGTAPSWIADEETKKRLQAYALYEAIYWCVPDTFKTMARGSETKPVYVPAGRTIVETLNRFMAPKMRIVPDPAFGTGNDVELANQVMTDFTRRERVYSKFSSNKRYGIMRGDWMFYLYADPAKPAGSRISFFELDPGTVFPIYDTVNPNDIIGYHVASPTFTSDGKDAVRRLTYLKTTLTSGPSPIAVEEALYKLDKWGGPGMNEDDAEVLEVTIPAFQLPAPIDDLPIYHIQNFNEPGSVWGSSEMRGVERMLAAINQGISDEELSLALDGLGVYATDAGTPVDADGNDTGWNLGPGRVVELPDGKSLSRVTGTATVEPSQAHLAYLHAVLDDVYGISDVAKGRADVTVAESGIALLVQLGPLLAHVEEKEEVVTDVFTNLLFNLAKWYVAYEGGAFRSLMDVTRWIPQYGPKIPENRAQSLAELVTLAQSVPQILPMSYVRDRLRKLGYEDLPDEDIVEKLITAEQAAATDLAGARIDQALTTIVPDTVPPA